MKNFEIEDSDRELIGLMKVKLENENSPHTLVYVHGISENLSEENKAMYNCRVFNTGETIFTYAENLNGVMSWDILELSRLKYLIKTDSAHIKFYEREIEKLESRGN